MQASENITCDEAGGGIEGLEATRQRRYAGWQDAVARTLLERGT